MTRREFLEATLALMAAPAVASASPAPGPVPRRRLGRTGVEVSMVGLGGAHLGSQATDAESIRIIRSGLDAGIDFLDNCWDYHDGRSELRMGKALRDGYRARAFLMTKIDGRDSRTATAQLEESLRRLQTDHLDLLQLHEIIREDDPDRAFAPGGAIEAMLAAKQAGKTRLLGFTGHKAPAYHLKMLEAAKAHGVRFDAVQLPLNVLDAHYDSFEKQVLPVLVRDGVAVLGMKPLAARLILESGAATAPECLRYAMSLPTSVVITGVDSMARLDQALRVVRDFRPYPEAEIGALLRRTAGAASGGRWEKYKTSALFDGTARHPEWLG